MTEIDPSLIEKDCPLSHSLLTHDGLMTPVLIRHFGPVHAVQTAAQDESHRFSRWSTIFQTASGAPLLRARLVLQKSTLPEGLIDALTSSNRLFGALLIEAGITVCMAGRVYFRLPPARGTPASYGRRHQMLRATDGLPLCEVEETLMPGPDLAGLAL